MVMIRNKKNIKNYFKRIKLLKKYDLLYKKNNTIPVSKGFIVSIDNQWYLKKIKSKLLNNKDLAKLATLKNPQSFNNFNPKFKKDEQMILNSVKNNKGKIPITFCRADKILKNKKSVVEKAINLDGNSILCANKKFINNRKLVFKAIDKGLNNFNYLPFKKYSQDYEFIKKTLTINSTFYPYINIKYRLNRELTITAIKKDSAINFIDIPKRFRSDKEIVLLVLINSLDVKGLKHVDKKLLLDGEFLLSILQKFSDEKKDIYLTTFTHSKTLRPLIWKYIGKKFMKDKSFIKKAIKIKNSYEKLFDLYDYSKVFKI